MAEEEETIGDVLSRTSNLNKEEMTTEVESYGLEVDSSWTKAEIMEHFEEFLTTDAGDAVPEETAAVPPVPPIPTETSETPYVPPPPPPPSSGAANYPGAVRIMGSPSARRGGWGTTPGAKAP